MSFTLVPSNCLLSLFFFTCVLEAHACCTCVGLTGPLPTVQMVVSIHCNLHHQYTLLVLLLSASLFVVVRSPVDRPIAFMTCVRFASPRCFPQTQQNAVICNLLFHAVSGRRQQQAVTYGDGFGRPASRCCIRELFACRYVVQVEIAFMLVSHHKSVHRRPHETELLRSSFILATAMRYTCCITPYQGLSRTRSYRQRGE
jgi:hypothetical protein